MFSIEFSMIAFAICHLLILYTKTERVSEDYLKEINGQLSGQNRIISKQNSEMEVMLREIHHRVKNNLQIVSSLLRLEANKSSESGEGFYHAAIDRVSAMALVHEKMYQSGSLSRFDLEKYLDTLVSRLLHSYSLVVKPDVAIHVEMKNMESRSVIPFALLINELLLNSMKHAFTEQKNPKICIEVIQNSEEINNRFSFNYIDNGKWNESATPSFGTEIIEAMTQQLDGQFQLEISEKGTIYRFELANLR